MTFDPRNPIVKLCLQGMHLEENGKPEEARQVFLEAWSRAQSALEKFLASHYLARLQRTARRN